MAVSHALGRCVFLFFIYQWGISSGGPSISLRTDDTIVVDGDKMTRVFLTDVTLPPKCIDGSPAAMYIAQNKSSTSYIIWLQGGGICENLENCIQRSQGELVRYCSTHKFYIMVHP